MHFVLACRLLCQQRISLPHLDLTDVFFVKFCTRVEYMYGKNVISPKMHMYGHWKEVVMSGSKLLAL